MKYLIRNGDHKSTPFTPKPWVKRVSGVFYLGEENKYILPDQDQGDWNKMVGISFNPLKPDYNAIMIGWRYNRDLDLFQVAPYFNVNGTIVNPDKTGSVRNVATYEKIAFYLDYNVVRLELDFGQNWINFKVPPMSKNYWTSFRIQPWFGGNRPSPKDMHINLIF